MTITEIVESKAPAVLRGRVTKPETERLLKELMDEHRIEYDKRIGAYYVPKMVRVGQQREAYRQFGGKGGNPALLSEAEREARSKQRQQEIETCFQELRKRYDAGQNLHDYMSTMNNKFGRGVGDAALAKLSEYRLTHERGKASE